MTASDDDEYAFIADLYDHVAPYHDRPDIAFFVESAREAGGPVLEVGCGTGRVLIPTARAGIDIVGLDLSPHMLAVCRERLSREPDAVRSRAQIVHADMRTFDLGRTFTLVTIPFRPFQHLLTVNDQLACLRTIHRHLTDGGRLLLDIFNPSIDMLAAPATDEVFREEPAFATPDGRRVTRRFRTLAHDRFAQVTDNEVIYDVEHPDGREERLVHPFQLRYSFRFEVEHLLARTGFAVEQLYADYEKSPFGSRYPGELLFVAKKAT